MPGLAGRWSLPMIDSRLGLVTSAAGLALAASLCVFAPLARAGDDAPKPAQPGMTPGAPAAPGAPGAMPPAAPAATPNGQELAHGRFFDTYDANGDGKVTVEEYAGGDMEVFNLLDANHDGVVTLAELGMPETY